MKWMMEQAWLLRARDVWLNVGGRTRLKELKTPEARTKAVDRIVGKILEQMS